MDILMLLVDFALICAIISDAAAQKLMKNRTMQNRKMQRRIAQNDCNSCGRINKGNPHQVILNGDTVRPSNKYPWMVSIQTIHGERICGGAIINEFYILTAAHCFLAHQYPPRSGSPGRGDRFVRPENIKVTFLTSGTATRHRSEVSEVIPHERFDGLRHDIGLLRMEEKITCDEFASPICLPKGAEHISIPGKLTLAGWGQINSMTKEYAAALQETELSAVPFDECTRLAPDFRSLKETYFCIKGKIESSACYGDSGSSMFQEKEGKAYTVGVVSRPTQSGCGVNFRTIFTSVLAHMPWISERIGDSRTLQSSRYFGQSDWSSS